MAVPTQPEIWARLQPSVQRDLLRRTDKVIERARDNLRGRNGYPRRVKTGRLLNDIRVLGTRTESYTISTWIGTDVDYAGYVRRGTGIYGPTGQRIVPRTAKALRFYWDRTGKVEFFRSVRGMPKNPFLSDSLLAARD